jgi:hypothetical protein
MRRRGRCPATLTASARTRREAARERGADIVEAKRTRRTRRARAEGGRPHSVRVSLSDFEAAAVHAAAARAGLDVAAWLGEAGLAQATRGRGPASSWGPVMQALMGAQAELAEARRVLRNVGGNLNDVAAHANATGEIHAATGRVLGLVARAVARVDTAAAGMAAATAAARAERLRGPW